MATKTISVEQYLSLPRDGKKYEIVAGELFVTPASYEHERLVMNIGFILKLYLQEHPIGQVVGSNVAFALPTGNIRCPDVALVLKEKLPAKPVTEGLCRIIPDLAVEILSPSDRPGEFADRVVDYLNSGVSVLWVIDPQQRSVRSISPSSSGGAGTEERLFRSDDTLSGISFLPDFSCPVAKIFES